jgi:hypothetical protein
MKPPSRFFLLPLSALVLAGGLALTPLLVRGAGTTPVAPVTPTTPVSPTATPPLGIQIAAGDHAVAVEHTLSEGTTCLIVVNMMGGAAAVCPPSGTPTLPPALPVGGGQ